MQRGFTLKDFMSQLTANHNDPGKGRNMPVHYSGKAKCTRPHQSNNPIIPIFAKRREQKDRKKFKINIVDNDSKLSPSDCGCQHQLAVSNSYYVHTYFRKGLRDLPGPRLARLSFFIVFQ
jgi:hypothetical protein